MPCRVTSPSALHNSGTCHFRFQVSAFVGRPAFLFPVAVYLRASLGTHPSCALFPLLVFISSLIMYKYSVKTLFKGLRVNYVLRGRRSSRTYTVHITFRCSMYSILVDYLTFLLKNFIHTQHCRYVPYVRAIIVILHSSLQYNS